MFFLLSVADLVSLLEEDDEEEDEVVDRESTDLAVVLGCKEGPSFNVATLVGEALRLDDAFPLFLHKKQECVRGNEQSDLTTNTLVTPIYDNYADNSKDT